MIITELINNKFNYIIMYTNSHNIINYICFNYKLDQLSLNIYYTFDNFINNIYIYIFIYTCINN